jgi:MFS family permease
MATLATDPTAKEAKPAAFFGWRVVAAAFTVLFVAYGIQFSFGVFVKQITDDMGWSRAQVLLPYALYVALYSALSSVSGWATDRFGPGRVVAVGGVILGLGWAGLGLSHSLWQVYLSLGVVAGIGMSATWVPCNATVVRWFVRRRGLAVGIGSTGGSAGNLIVPPLATAVVGLVGWRSTLPLMAAVGAVLMVGCSRFLIRDPETLGLHPDGDPTPPVTTATSLSDADSFTFAQACRTATFWCLFGIFALTWLAVFVPFAHVVAFAKDLDIGALAASTVLSAIGLGGLAGRLSAGPLSDRIGRRATLALLLSLQVVSFVLFAASHGLVLLYPAAVLFGATYGGSTTMFPAIVGDQFGRAYAGTIVGASFASAGSFAAIGPYVAAAIYDATNSYRVAFLLCAGVNALSLAMVSLLRPPKRRRTVAPSPAPAAVAVAPC